MPPLLSNLGVPNQLYNLALQRLRETQGSTVTPSGVGSTAPPVGVGGGGGGVGVQPVALGAAVPRWASWAPVSPQKPIAKTIAAAHVPSLSQNAQLPQHPLGAYTDSQYEAENATLEQQINAAYQDVLQQTGYDVEGKHIPGAIEQDAARKERDFLTGMVNSDNEVTGQMQQAGTIFSGYHAAQRAKGEQPFITGLGDLAVDTPKALTHGVETAADLIRQYTANQNMLLMQAAARRAAMLAAQQAQASSQQQQYSQPQEGPYPIGPAPANEVIPPVGSGFVQVPTAQGSTYMTSGESKYATARQKKKQLPLGYYVGGRY